MVLVLWGRLAACAGLLKSRCLNRSRLGVLDSLPVFETGANLLRREQFTPLGRSITVFDVGRDSGTILRQPFFLIVELAHRFLDEIIGGFIGPRAARPAQ
jgi:hypothetical protein